MINPFNCKEVTTRLALGDLSGAGRLERLAIRFHLAYCWFCKKYERQMKVIGTAFRASIDDRRRQSDSAAFKERLLRSLSRPR